MGCLLWVLFSFLFCACISTWLSACHPPQKSPPSGVQLLDFRSLVATNALSADADDDAVVQAVLKHLARIVPSNRLVLVLQSSMLAFAATDPQQFLQLGAGKPGGLKTTQAWWPVRRASDTVTTLQSAPVLLDGAVLTQLWQGSRPAGVDVVAQHGSLCVELGRCVLVATPMRHTAVLPGTSTFSNSRVYAKWLDKLVVVSQRPQWVSVTAPAGELSHATQRNLPFPMEVRFLFLRLLPNMFNKPHPAENTLAAPDYGPKPKKRKRVNAPVKPGLRDTQRTPRKQAQPQAKPPPATTRRSGQQAPPTAAAPHQSASVMDKAARTRWQEATRRRRSAAESAGKKPTGKVQAHQAPRMAGGAPAAVPKAFAPPGAPQAPVPPQAGSPSQVVPGNTPHSWRRPKTPHK